MGGAGSSVSAPPQNAAATKDVEIYGMEISANVIPCVCFALDKKCGKFVLKDMMQGELKTPEMLEVNPWHQMPSMKDGDFCLGESGAILRYLANTYGHEAYGGMDPQERAMIDWAMDWTTTNFLVNNYKQLWYPVAGFGEAGDYAAATTAALENLKKF